MKRKSHIKIFLLLSLLLAAIVVYARPGGGHSYSGGGSYGGGYSGGGGGSGDLIFALLYMLPPEVSVPVIVILFIFFAFKKSDRQQQKFTFSSHQPNFYDNLTGFTAVSQQIAMLRGLDPNFSRVLFLDFVSSLYTKFYAYQNDKKQLTTLSPFFDKSLLDKFLKEKTSFRIGEIVIGGLYIERINIKETTDIYVRFKSNMTIEAAGKAGRYIVDERWLLRRDKDVVSPEPEKMHTVSCPACGAPADFTDAGYCKHCGTLVVPGKMQWYVAERTVFSIKYFPAKQLLTYQPERGTSLPTIFDPYLEQKIKVFEQANNVTWTQYEQKFKDKVVRPYFDEIYRAWSSLKWEKVRHLLSDRLWESYNFWIKAYREHRIRNVLDIKIEKVETVKLEIDRFYEAITVRIFANGLDYVADLNGKVLAGSKRQPRRFSEYWTFIRRSGVEKDDYDIHTCPACGAPADNIGQSGICEYCGNKITWGDFSWIVAIITQDEEYRG